MSFTEQLREAVRGASSEAKKRADALDRIANELPWEHNREWSDLSTDLKYRILHAFNLIHDEELMGARLLAELQKNRA
jgi:hypothetical protein